MSAEDENKFNFSEEEPKATPTEETAPPTDAKGLWQGIKSFLYELLDIRHDVDKDQTGVWSAMP